MQRKKTVKIVRNTLGYAVKATVDGRKVTLSGRRGFYSTDDSARRAWRKYAAKNNVTNYIYASI